MSAPPPIIQLHQLSLYNTGRMSPEQIIAAFAARRPLLDRILSDLTAEEPGSRAQHHLIVGQRGMGKTMLLARIAAGLKKDDDSSGRFLPLVFAEEQYAVDRLSKFWLNCLDSLADFHENTKDQTAAAAIDEEVERLTRAAAAHAKNDEPFAGETFAAFTAAAARTGQRPVLLVDNLQLVFERLSKEQQHSLREVLMRPGSPILIGASPSPPPATSDYGAAFYDHFKVHYLRPLEEQEMRDLLLHLAAAAGRDDVRQRVLQHPARLKVLRQLTGGNPRTTLTLFFLYAEDFAPSVFGDLEGLLDRVTPLYKARLEELTDQQQVIVSAAADHWNPVTAAKLAQITALPATTISAQLDRLERTGVVERVEVFPTEERRAEYGTTTQGYQIAERFFNVWFLFRSASRRQRREIEFLTRFLETFYEPPDRFRLARHIMAEQVMTADRYLWSRALAASLTDKGTADDLCRHADLLALREEAEEASRKMHELIDFTLLPPATLAFEELRRKIMSLAQGMPRPDAERFVHAVLGCRAMFCRGERERLASRGSPLSQEEWETILASIEKSQAEDIGRFGRTAVHWFSARMAEGQLRDLNDLDDWNRTILRAEITDAVLLALDTIPRETALLLSHESVEQLEVRMKQNSGWSGTDWLRWGVALEEKLDRPADAELAYREAASRLPGFSVPWVTLGNVLSHRLARYEDAVHAYSMARSLEPRIGIAWIGCAVVLKDHLDRGEQAEKILRDAIELKLNLVEARVLLADLLQSRQNGFTEAESLYRETLADTPESGWAWLGLANLLRKYPSRSSEAEDAYLQAISSDSKLSPAFNDLGNLYCDELGKFNEAEECFQKAFKLVTSKDVPLQNLVFLERDFRGNMEAGQLHMRKLRSIESQKYPDTTILHETLFAACESNWGHGHSFLKEALALRSEGLAPGNTDDWLRASAVLLHLNYGADLLALLDAQKDTVAKLRPWVEALRAHVAGDRRYLKNIAPEIRATAEIFYDGIDSRLQKLPEKTRRRPLPNQKGKRRKS